MSKISETETRCCENEPVYSVLYSVAGEKKLYCVCLNCIKLPCFSKFIIEKTPIPNNNLKNKSKNSNLRSN